MRLIDADALELILNNAIEMIRAMAKALDCEDDPEIKMEIKAYTDILNGVKEQPTEPQIIRCKDCIHYKPMSNDSEWGYCSVHGNRTCQSIDFCAWAERETDETIQDNP